MLGFEAGTCNGSDLYFQSPSEQARKMLFYMTSCGYYYTDKDYKIDRPHYSDARYLLIYIRSGQLSVTVNTFTSTARRGQIVLLDCSIPHAYHTIDHAEFVWIHLDGSNCPNSLNKYAAYMIRLFLILPALRKSTRSCWTSYMLGATTNLSRKRGCLCVSILSGSL